MSEVVWERIPMLAKNGCKKSDSEQVRQMMRFK